MNPEQINRLTETAKQMLGQQIRADTVDAVYSIVIGIALLYCSYLLGRAAHKHRDEDCLPLYAIGSAASGLIGFGIVAIAIDNLIYLFLSPMFYELQKLVGKG